MTIIYLFITDGYCHIRISKSMSDEFRGSSMETYWYLIHEAAVGERIVSWIRTPRFKTQLVRHFLPSFRLTTTITASYS